MQKYLFNLTNCKSYIWLENTATAHFLKTSFNKNTVGSKKKTNNLYRLIKNKLNSLYTFYALIYVCTITTI